MLGAILYCHHRSLVFLLLLPITTALWANNANLPADFEELPTDVQAVIMEFVYFPDEANEVWGEDFAQSGIYQMVKYLDDFHTRVMINFDAGFVQVESRGSNTPVQSLQQAITATLLTPADPSSVDLYTAADMGLTGKPFLAGQIKDHEGKDILYPLRAQQYAKYLTSYRLQQHGNRHWVTIPMASNHKAVGALRYRQPVLAAADRYRLSPQLIYGIIETESSFNPFAVSPANAYGLMQVVRSTAGKDVFQRIYRRSDKPSRNFLFNANNNIDVGSAYLSILRDIYLKDIRGWQKREYCMIAAYNGGAGNLLKTFHRDRKKAIARINAMSDQEVYNTIVRRHPKLESRNYLKKVTKAKRRYAQI